MAKENFFGSVFSSTYDFFAEGSANLIGAFHDFTKSIQGIKFLEHNYIQRIKNIGSVIEIQKSEVAFLEKHAEDSQSVSLLKEISNLKDGLDKLSKEKEKLEQELRKLVEMENSFEIPAEASEDPMELFKADLKQMIAHGKLESCLDNLMESLVVDCNAADDVILFSSKLRSIDKQSNLGLISLIEHNRLQNNIVSGVIRLVNDLDAGDLK